MKIKLSVLLSILIFMNGCANSENINGFWSGSMEMNGKTIDLSIDLNSKDKFFSSYDLMLLEQPISNLTIKNGIFSFSVILDVEVVFNGTILGEEITGTATINGGPPDMNIIFSLTKQAEKPVKPYSVESLTIKSNDVSLSVDIYKPYTEGLHPAIVLLHGSSTNLKSDYIFDADYFAKLGFEVLIFDKRGNGKSTGNYYLSSYDDLIADAIICLEIMYKRESVNKDKIGLWGFSQGAMLLPKIVSKTNIPKFLIAKSPEIISVTEAAAFSDSLRIVNSGGSELNGKIVAESHRKVEKMIREGKSYNEVELFIQENAQQNNFMNQTGLYGNINIDKNEYNGFYWQGRKEYFVSFWENINIPMLVLLGDRDNFVNAEKNNSILKSLNKENIEIKLFPKANHNLKKTFNPTIDTEFDWPRIIEGYSDYVEKWIKSEVEK
ncbi:MAG: alpha/beta fold hydrolase [Bacteroidetes bacterium]|nr:alpha/beta fold hydrolase [Bacteroidota bacterium]